MAVRARSWDEEESHMQEHTQSEVTALKGHIQQLEAELKMTQESLTTGLERLRKVEEIINENKDQTLSRNKEKSSPYLNCLRW